MTEWRARKLRERRSSADRSSRGTLHECRRSERGNEDARAGRLGDDDPEHRLLALAELCALGDEPQPAEVDVGARHDRDEALVLADEVVLLDVLLGAGDAESARWLGDRARVCGRKVTSQSLLCRAEGEEREGDTHLGRRP